MDEYEVLGILTTIGKEGKVFSTLYFATGFPEYRAEKAVRAEGVVVVKENTSLDVSSLKVGDLVNLVYARGYEDKAKLVKILKVQ